MLAHKSDNNVDAFVREQETSISRKVNKAVERVTQQLQDTRRGDQPTKYEQFLDVFMEQPDKVVLIDELASILEGATDPEGLARDTICRLNKKLQEKGVRIKHVPAYRLVPLDPDS